MLQSRHKQDKEKQSSVVVVRQEEEGSSSSSSRKGNRRRQTTAAVAATSSLRFAALSSRSVVPTSAVASSKVEKVGPSNRGLLEAN